MSEVAVVDVSPVVESATPTPTPEAVAPETQTSATPESTQEVDSMAARFAALSKKEKAIVERERQLREQYETKVSAWEKAQQEAKANPVKYLESLGLTLEDVANHVLSNNEEQPLSPEELRVKQIEDKLTALEQQRIREQQEAEQAAIAAQQQMIEQTVTGYKNVISQYLSENPDTYELTAQLDSVDLVFDVTEQYYHQTGKLLPLDQAVKAVEEYWEAEVERVMQLNKIKTKYGRTAPEEPMKESGAERSVTLTNRVGTTPTPVVETSAANAVNFDQYLEDSKRRAAEFLERELAKKTR